MNNKAILEILDTAMKENCDTKLCYRRKSVLIDGRQFGYNISLLVYPILEGDPVVKKGDNSLIFNFSVIATVEKKDRQIKGYVLCAKLF